MHVTVFENSFSHSTRALGYTVKRHNLGLHIGGKSGVFCSTEIDSLGPTRHLNPNPIVAIRHNDTRLAQFINDCVQQIGARMSECYITTGRGNCTQKSTRFDTIGNHSM